MPKTAFIGDHWHFVDPFIYPELLRTWTTYQYKVVPPDALQPLEGINAAKETGWHLFKNLSLSSVMSLLLMQHFCLSQHGLRLSAAPAYTCHTCNMPHMQSIGHISVSFKWGRSLVKFPPCLSVVWACMKWWPGEIFPLCCHKNGLQETGQNENLDQLPALPLWDIYYLIRSALIRLLKTPVSCEQGGCAVMIRHGEELDRARSLLCLNEQWDCFHQPTPGEILHHHDRLDSPGAWLWNSFFQFSTQVHWADPSCFDAQFCIHYTWKEGSLFKFRPGLWNSLPLTDLETI